MQKSLLAIMLVVAGGVLIAQEPPAYMLAKLTITDQETYGNYRSGFGDVFQEYGGEILAASAEPTVLEGEWEATITVSHSIRFEERGTRMVQLGRLPGTRPHPSIGFYGRVYFDGWAIAGSCTIVCIHDWVKVR
ncbi:MAG: hypothetical protein Ct9H300mP25_12830 [Acidobacteriota bacterium]|nr:MAG: hypothetical protein Ct9H300mP25_12830 [Acidobacteriota bacterium]